ncbi:hypothetical protein B0T19DRAFT_355407 [Cercophora scortea]|uniref:Uncharacterized protein n=1 Tax=Cercophora scortea TaxID=314031 RepID=A0AAE0IZM4_9PEZI|nr:hypothetical protein B0T19DRAFT_355407 [Cercophora scortea]
MASNLQIHKPYVLKALSRPLDRPEGPGRHIIGEVFGQKQGSKKRKRSELSVAIDGDSVHLYDIPSSQAITSYLVSPQSFFTCAPYSLRLRSATTKDTSRFTYVSTQDSLSSKREIKLFKDLLNESGNTTSTITSKIYRCDKPIVHLSATSYAAPSDELPSHHVVAVAADGAVIGFHGDTLEKQWQSSPSVLTQELSEDAHDGLEVSFVQSTTAADVIDGMFGGKNDLFGVFQEKVDRDGFNPDILIVITSSKETNQPKQRYLHILALSTGNDTLQTNKQHMIPVFVAPLASKAGAVKYQLDVRSGTLQELSGGVLSTYTFNAGSPRLENKLEVPDMTSFLRLSKSSVLAATSTSLSVYNPIYRSLQTTTPLTVAEESHCLSAPQDVTCELVTYLAGREIAVGLWGTSLIAVQIEAPKGRNSKRRAEGLLSDAIRRGLSREHVCEKHSKVEHAPAVILSDTLPGSMSETYWTEWQSEVAKADEHLRSGDLAAFEAMLANTFKIKMKKKSAKPNGVHNVADTNGATSATSLPEWKWPTARTDYPQVDRRWVFYAINKVFAWNSAPDATRLTCRLPESNVLNYLVDAGHLSISNIKSAFKDEIVDVDGVDNVLGEEVPPLLVQIDPTMELLLGYLSGTQLGPTELVSAIKLILRSLDLLEDPSKTHALRIKESGEQAPDGDNDMISIELDRAEEELQVTEHYLGSESSRRARGLSVAFSKLAMCPVITTVQSLRRLLKPEETMCLMNVLRMELIKDGWTTRYLDMPRAHEEEIEAPPDGSIQLIADLLCRCIDSVGLGGWMAFDTMAAGWGSSQQEDSADFFSQFQAEVSVALEGILEAVRLQGTLAEAFNYANKATKAVAEGKNKASAVSVTTGALPFGLKTDMGISLERVRSGAEIVPRSSRQIGLFVSKKRQNYSVHRISEESLLERAGVKVLQEAM